MEIELGEGILNYKHSYLKSSNNSSTPSALWVFRLLASWSDKGSLINYRPQIK
jgi:hypothetical protein